MNFNQPFSPKKPKYRFYFSWLSAFILAIIARTTTTGFWLGVPIIIFGELFRIWSQGFIEKGSKLAVSGLYAYTRNPLYISNFFIGLGFVLILSNFWFVLVYSIGFCLIYSGIIRQEEGYLSNQFGSLYQDYCAHVPRVFPRLIAYPKRSNESFRWKLVLKHGEHIAFSSILLLLISLYLRQEWFQKGRGLFSGEWPPVYASCLLIICLIIATIHRRYFNK